MLPNSADILNALFNFFLHSLRRAEVIRSQLFSHCCRGFLKTIKQIMHNLRVFYYTKNFLMEAKTTFLYENTIDNFNANFYCFVIESQALIQRYISYKKHF